MSRRRHPRTPDRHRRRACAAWLGAVFLATAVGAADYYYFGGDSTLGANGTANYWNGTGLFGNGRHWATSPDGAWNKVAWNATAGSETWTAVFAGRTGGTVTLGDAWGLFGGTVYASDLRFSTTGYTLAAQASLFGDWTLNLTGTVPSVTTDTGVTATITAPLAGSAGLVKQGAGTLVLSGSNTYGGETRVAAGTLQLGSSSALASASTLNVAGGTFALGANRAQVAKVTLTSGTITGSTGLLTSTQTFAVQSGTITATLAGSAGLTKTTIGTVLLGGANTYTGKTLVSGGTLRVDGSLARGSAVEIARAGTLEGTGVINGAVDVYGTIGAGTAGALGTLRTGAQTWHSGGTYHVDFSASGSDLLDVTGLLTFDRSATQPGFEIALNWIDASALTSMTGRSWTLVSTSGGIRGFETAGVSLNTDALGLGASAFTLSTIDGKLLLSYTAIPEPATCAFAFGAAALGFLGYRRWRRPRA